MTTRLDLFDLRLTKIATSFEENGKQIKVTILIETSVGPIKIDTVIACCLLSCLNET